MTYYSFSHYNGKEWLCVSCTPSSTIQLHSTVAKGQLHLPLMKPISTECTHIIWVHISWSMLKISKILVKPSAPPSRSFHILTESCLQESFHPGDFYNPSVQFTEMTPGCDLFKKKKKNHFCLYSPYNIYELFPFRMIQRQDFTQQ